MTFTLWFNRSSPSLLKAADRFFETYPDPDQDIIAVSLSQEIDQFFEKYPDHPYQNIFAVPYLRQALVAYVTDKIFGASETDTDVEQQLSAAASFCRSFERQIQLENWIHAGMTYVLQKNSDWVAQMIKCEFLSTRPRKFR